MSELRISQLAASSGVPASTLRFYESEGLLPAGRSPNGYRMYGAAAQERLAFISAAKKLQLSLPDIRNLLAVWETESCSTVKEELRPAIRAQLDRAEGTIAALTTLRETLSAALSRLDETPDRPSRCDPECVFLAEDHGTRPAPEPTPVACSLGGADHAARINRWHELLADAEVTTTTEGVTAVVPANRAGDIASLVVAEQQCCDFIEFTLAFQGPSLEISMTTPPAGRTQLDELLPHAGLTR